MAKAVLVMDMPKTCKDCVLCIASQEKHSGQFCWRCVNHPTVMIPKEGIKPDWCPLKPVPEKREPDERYYESSYVDIGFNACIDAICGKE